MNEYLAELYGTEENLMDEEDFEKQAAAEFLVKLAAEEGVDLDSLSDEEVSDLLEDIESGGYDDESQEKLAEADFLGRAMAHAYVDELTEIEKEAERISEKEGLEFARKAKSDPITVAGKKVQRQRADLPFRGAPEAPDSNIAWKRSQRAEKGRQAFAKAQGGGLWGATKRYHRRGAGHLKAALGGKWGGKASKMSRLAARGGHLARGAAHFAPHMLAAGGLAYGAKKALSGGSEKRSFNEAIEDAAAERAYEMLAEAGYDIEKVAGDDVEIRALQMLEEAGYPVEL